MFKQRFTDDDDFDNSDEKIVLDKAAFKALASDKRVEILKQLDIRRKTLTELSDHLGLAVATVKEHMEHLASSDLIKLVDEGRKWKYYELTGKGKAILYPEQKKIWVMLASLFFMLLLSGYMGFYDLGYLPTGESSDLVQSQMAPRQMRIAADMPPPEKGMQENTEAMIAADEKASILSADQEDAVMEPVEDDETIDEPPTLDVATQDVDDRRPYIRHIIYGLTAGLAVTLVFVVTQHAMHKKKMRKKR
ncbi:MAG: ArsR family transcriptional regulator [Nanoarchaeota archaeon]